MHRDFPLEIPRHDRNSCRENDDINMKVFPCDFDHPKECVSPDFLSEWDSRAGRNPSLNVKRPKVYAMRDFPLHCGSQSKLLEELKHVEPSKESNAVNTSSDLNSKQLCSGMKRERAKSLSSWSQKYVSSVIGQENAAPVRSSEKRTFVEDDGAVPVPMTGTNHNSVPNKENQAARDKVKAVLKLFNEVHRGLSNDIGLKGNVKGARRVDVEAAGILKKNGKWVCPVKKLGHIPGVEIGDQFHFRAQLAVVGLHSQYVSGIDFLKLNGKTYATSIVNSGRYENRARSGDVLVYTGQGGSAGFSGCKLGEDQELRRGNLALKNSMDEGHPVRVIQKSRSTDESISDREGLAYTYDGLYIVRKIWKEKEDGRSVFKFELHKSQGQPTKFPHHITAVESRKSFNERDRCILEDVSLGKEEVKIRLINGIDDESIRNFSYITSPIYPDGFEQVHDSGCNCTEKCSNEELCLCLEKNRGEDAFNDKGSILDKSRGIVYACGPSCKCPPSCTNRFEKNGPKYQLEVFRTKRQGWGVRSRGFISSGSFVCEYIGRFVEIKTARQRAELRLMGFEDASVEFMIDASKMGNVGRFISHSSSPNLFAQEMMYDHGDDRMPHIMLFASKNIPPMQELTLNYSHYQKIRIC